MSDTTPSGDAPQNVQNQVKAALTQQKQEDKAQRMYDEYVKALPDERAKRLFTGMLKAIQQEANEKGLVIGDGGNISIEDAFGQAYESVAGYKYGDTPPTPEEPTEDKTLPPGKQATTKPAGVQTKIDTDPMPEVGEMPLENVELYIDARRAIRGMTKSRKQDKELFQSVENTIADVIKQREEKNKT